MGVDPKNLLNDYHLAAFEFPNKKAAESMHTLRTAFPELRRLGQVRALTDQEILSVPGLGRAAVRELRALTGPPHKHARNPPSPPAGGLPNGTKLWRILLSKKPISARLRRFLTDYFDPDISVGDLKVRTDRELMLHGRAGRKTIQELRNLIDGK